jgi:3-hydroxyisobutyrate dehydrogenase
MSQTIGFIGLGNMGSRMATRLVDAGHTVIGFDPGRQEAAGIVTTLVTTLDEVADAPLILMSLPDASVVSKVMRGGSAGGGLMNSLGSGHTVVDFTTSSPALTSELSVEAAAKGAVYLDAGISGGAAGAESGQLTLMVGGSSDALDAVRGVLDVVATTIVFMGASGSGHATKILNNFLNAMNLSASAEVLVAAKAAGLDVATVLEVINASSGANWATQKRFPRIIEGDYLEGGLTSQLMMKDIQLYLDYVGEVGVPSLHASGPVAAFGSAIQRGYGDLISNRVVDALGDMAGGIRLSDPTDT